MKDEPFYFNNRCSVQMEHVIDNIDTLERFEELFSAEFLNDDTQLSDYLTKLIYKYDTDCYSLSKRAGFASLSYAGNIARGTKHPTRDSVLALCIGLGATVEETQHLLKYSGHAPLYVRKKRDVIVWFAIRKGLDIYDLNSKLVERGYKPLSAGKS